MYTDHCLKYAIFEDEPITRIFIERAVGRLRPHYLLCGGGDSVHHITDLLLTSTPHFIITGCLLSDGVSLDCLKHLDCRCPLIIFTAYKRFLRETEGLNVSHYALKPVSEAEVEIALRKVEEEIDESLTTRPHSLAEKAHSPA